MPKLKCDVCGQHKGKRACPAREGHWICPQCCAQNRVQTFACPASCPYLGGEGSLRLAQTRREDFTPPPGDTVREFLDELMAGARGSNVIADVEPAAVPLLARLGELAKADGAAEVIDAALFEWVAFGARGSGGQRLIDRVVTHVTRPLTTLEMDALEALHRSHHRLLRTQETLGADRIRATDLLSEEPVEVAAPGLPERFGPGQCFAAAVTPTAEGPTVLLGALGLPEGGVATVLTRLRALHEASPLKDGTIQDFLTRCSIVVPLLLQEHFASQAPAQRDPLDEPPPFL